MLQPWMARAMTPLPVPLSPRMRMVASLVATCLARSTACRIAVIFAVQVNAGVVGQFALQAGDALLQSAQADHSA